MSRKRRRASSTGRGEVTHRAPTGSEAPTSEDPWVWIEGLHPLGTWMPLYNFPKDSGLSRARGTLKYILRLDRPGRELAEYLDFRVNLGDLSQFEFEPSPEVRARYTSLGAQRSPKALQRPADDGGDSLQPPGDSEGSESPTEARLKPTEPARPRNRCIEVYDAIPRFRCNRERQHGGKHKDRYGHEWEP